MPLAIRPATPDDRAALSRICLLTSNAGTDGSQHYGDPEYPGLIYSVPYLDFAPAHAFVVADGAECYGYVVGTPDTRAFEARLDRDWWPPLRERYARHQPEREFDAKVLDRFKTPERGPEAIVVDHPAHLHINLLPEAQSGGWGRRLIEIELASLKAAGARAVHLGVSPTNERAMGFYRHLGFVEAGRHGAVYFAKLL